MKKLLVIVALLVGTIGCTDAQKAKIGGLGNTFHVEMYSGGKLVREWTSTGKVQSEGDSDGYFFMDSKTNKLVEVSGDVVVTRID